MNETATEPEHKRRWYQYSLRSLLIFMLVAGVFFGWVGKIILESNKPISSILPESAERVINVQAALDKVFTDSARVLFLSYNGVWNGMHNDVNIELQANGTAVLTEYTDCVFKYYGTYSITEATDGTTSEVTLSLKDYHSKWPVMAVYTDRSKLLLFPTEVSYEFILDDPLPWLFRQIQIPQKTQ